jgi:hypothetical protein
VTNHPEELSQTVYVHEGFTPYDRMGDFSSLVFDHTVRIWRLLGPCAVVSLKCPNPSAIARHGPSYRARPDLAAAVEGHTSPSADSHPLLNLFSLFRR